MAVVVAVVDGALPSGEADALCGALGSDPSPAFKAKERGEAEEGEEEGGGGCRRGSGGS